MTPTDSELVFERAKQLFLEGTHALEQGQLVVAEAKLLECLALVPDRESTKANLAVTYSLRADLLAEQGDTINARALYDKALALDPACAVAASNKGLLLSDALDSIDAAIACFEAALQHNPAYADARLNLGVCWSKMGAYQKALEHFDLALEIDANYVEAWINRGNALASLRRFEEALASYDKALAISPESAEAWSNRCDTLKSLGRYEEALASSERSIALRPHYAAAWLNRGVALYDLHRYEDALASYDKAIEIYPNYAEAWSNRGNVLSALKRLKEALECCDRALALKPDYGEAWSNRGNLLHELGRLEDALTSYNNAVEFKPTHAEAWSNRGITLNDLRRHSEAFESYDRAIDLSPESANTYLNKSLDLLRLGDFDSGWRLYEWRWKSDTFVSPRRHFSQPLWLGEPPLEGKTVLLHAEQGLGDTIQFCRYAKSLSELGAKVVMEIERPLVGLLSSLVGVERIIEAGASLPNFDYHCPLLSLPLALKTQVHAIPNHVPYLRVSSAKRDAWAQHLSLSRDKPSIGIVWSGNPKHRNDHNRSIGLDAMLGLLSDKFYWFCLKKDLLPEERHKIEAAGIRDLSAELQDFSDTAALTSHLDLVICVDTSVAHLAGALGKPVWLLLPYVPDFRWMWDREDSPWYPTMRIFRQPAPGDWLDPIARVKEELVTSL